MNVLRSMRALVTAFAGVLLVGAAVVVNPAVAVARTPAGAFAPGAVLTPNPSAFGNQLISVSADSSTDAWAVGYYGTDSSGDSNTLTLHWNGSKWTKVSSPNPMPGHVNQLMGVFARASNDVWAVGQDVNYSVNNSEATLILHWNGTKWSQVASPNPAPSGGTLQAVSADSSGDAWAVGAVLGGVSGTLTLHWNGSSWSQVASPSPGAPYNNLTGVSAISTSAAWAVGTYYNSTANAYDTMTLEWNGTKWSQVTSPNPNASGENRLTAVSARAANDIWAVGTVCSIVSAQCAFSDESTLIIHWNGTAWSQVASPNTGTNANFLNGVSADPTSANDAWAVGLYKTSTGASDSLTLRWNGTKWSKVSSPNPSTTTNSLQSVSSASPTSALAVGYYFNASSVLDTYGLHWTGTKWIKV